MAKLISPGVAVVEKDFTTIVPNVSASFGGIAGRFSKGPVLDPVLVSKEDELELVFGKPNSTNYTEWHTAAEFLKYADRLWVVRAASANAKNAGVNVDQTSVTNGYYANQDEIESATFTDEGDFIARESGIQGNKLLVIAVDAFNWTDFVAFCVSKEAINGYFPNNVGWHRYVNGAPTTSAFVAERTGRSDVNDEVHIFVIDAVGDGARKKFTILELHEGLSVCVDSRAENGSSLYYPNALLQNSSLIFSGTNPVPSDVGGVSQISKVVSNVARSGNIATLTTDTNHGFSLGDTVIVSVSEQPTFSTNTAVILSIPTPDTFTYANVGADVGSTAVSTGTRTAVRNAIPAGINWGSSVERLYGNSAVFAALTDIDFSTMTSLQGGADGSGATEQTIKDAYDQLASVEEFDVNLIMTAAFNNVITKHVAESVVAIRKDAIGFVSAHDNAAISGDRLKGDIATILSDTVSYKNTDLALSNDVAMYNFMDSGWKYIFDKYNNIFRWVPLNGDMAGLCARTSATNDDWWSPGGYNRGGLKNVLKLSYNPNNAHRDELYRNGINPVISVAGSGVLLFGDKTMTSKPSAFDRVNVRRLFNVLQKAISTAAKFSLFEFNDTFTRSQFRGMVEPFLRAVQGRRGITAFSVVCDESNNTPDVIDRNEFVAEILIQPARSINFITLSFVATRTGVDFSTVIGG